MGTPSGTRDLLKTERKIPRWAELQPLLRPRPFIWNGTDRRLARAESVFAVREQARRRVPRAVFDYTDGAAGQELAARRAREALEGVVFHPRVLRDVSNVDLSTTVLGRETALPFGLAPTGFTRMMHHQGELAVARSARRFGIPYGLSTMGTTSVEEVEAAAPGGRHWFQLYLWRDREASRGLIERARDSGYEALVLTVDTPVGGPRLRDVRNGLTIPPSLTARTVFDAARKPAWWLNLLSTEPLEFGSLKNWNGTVAELASAMFDPAARLADIEWLRELWPGKLIIKGIQCPEDAVMVVEAGADAVVLSNHGGRQLDRAVTPLESLPAVKEALGGRAEIMVDGGFMSGSDVAVALSLGADFVLIGRAYLYGLMAGGERGVDRVLELMRTDLQTTMQLLGAPRVEDLVPGMVSWAERR